MCGTGDLKTDLMHAKQAVYQLSSSLAFMKIALIHHPKQIEDTLIPVRKLNKTKFMFVPYIYGWSVAIFLNYVSIGSLNSLDVIFHKIRDYQIFLLVYIASIKICSNCITEYSVKQKTSVSWE